uniref:Uncharacterized protein n=1 Tax=Tanacetum cinerariifolium TaxID=118510 RepID=A0A699JG86_TANCI|nr:hypothetical protein [Tanacetum cinerariifolium]
MATKSNLGEVVTTCERSWVQASPWGFFFMSDKKWGLSPKAKVRVLHTAQLDVTKEKADVTLTCPMSDGEPLHLALRMDGIKEESPQKLQVTMVISMPTVQTHARLHANSVSHSPPKAKVKDYEYYKTKMLLAKKDKDEQVLLAEDQAWMESSSDSDYEINVNMVFMVQIEKVLSDSDASSSSVDEKISEVSYYLSESESESEFETLEYCDNSTNYGLYVNNNDDQEIFYDAIESASENFIKNHIDSQKDYDNSDVDHNDSEEKDQLVDKLIRKFNQKIAKC